MDNNSKTKSLCFYGGKYTQNSVARSFGRINAFLEKRGTCLDALSFYNFNTYKKSKRKYSVKNLDVLLSAQNTFDKKCSIGAQKNWNTGFNMDYLIYINFAHEESIISFVDEIVDLADDDVRALLLSLADILESRYSVCMFLPYYNMPPFYAHGIGHGDKNDFMAFRKNENNKRDL